MDIYHVIKRPMVTEKGTYQSEKLNAYAFEVTPDANKAQIRQAVDIFPFPGFELLDVGVQADVFVAAREAQGEPALHLPAITAAPDTGRNLGRQVVFQPFRMLGDDFGLAGADFLAQFAQGGLAGAFALVDSALRHLPVIARRVDAVADPDTPVRAEQHQPDAGTLGTRVVR